MSTSAGSVSARLVAGITVRPPFVVTGSVLVPAVTTSNRSCIPFAIASPGSTYPSSQSASVSVTYTRIFVMVLLDSVLSA